MKYKFPISGSIIVDTDDDVLAEKELALWIFEMMRQNQGTNFNLPDVFEGAVRPTEIVLQIDHNHVAPCSEERYAQIMEEARQYQIKKLAQFLPKKKREAVLAALHESDESNSNGLN